MQGQVGALHPTFPRTNLDPIETLFICGYLSRISDERDVKAFHEKRHSNPWCASFFLGRAIVNAGVPMLELWALRRDGKCRFRRAPMTFQGAPWFDWERHVPPGFAYALFAWIYLYPRRMQVNVPCYKCIQGACAFPDPEFHESAQKSPEALHPFSLRAPPNRLRRSEIAPWWSEKHLPSLRSGPLHRKS